MSKFVYCKMHHYEYRLEPSSHARLWEPREGGPFLPIRSVLKNTTRGALIFMFRVKNTSGVLSSSSLTPLPAGRCEAPPYFSVPLPSLCHCCLVLTPLPACHYYSSSSSDRSCPGHPRPTRPALMAIPASPAPHSLLWLPHAWMKVQFSGATVVSPQPIALPPPPFINFGPLRGSSFASASGFCAGID